MVPTQMETKMESEMETGIVKWLIGIGYGIQEVGFPLVLLRA